MLKAVESFAFVVANLAADVDAATVVFARAVLFMVVNVPSPTANCWNFRARPVHKVKDVARHIDYPNLRFSRRPRLDTQRWR